MEDHNMDFTKGGDVYIAGLIRDAVDDNTWQVIVSGNWEIEHTVTIPSDFTVILQNFHSSRFC